MKNLSIPFEVRVTGLFLATTLAVASDRILSPWISSRFPGIPSMAVSGLASLPGTLIAVAGVILYSYLHSFNDA